MHNQSVVGTCLLCLLALIFAACSNNPGGTQTATKSPGTTINNPTTSSPTPNLSTNGTNLCPTAVSPPSYWSPIVGTQSGMNQVESVICTRLEGDTTQQALIAVRSNGSGGFLDIYVYTKITDPQPQQIFKLQGLAQGTARISNYNTIITSEVDVNSRINQGKPDAQLQPDLYREFEWSANAGLFIQVAFPGLYPYLTRYQAEDAQAQVNQGKLTGLTDARQVANNFATSLLKWSGAQITIDSGGGAQDVAATVTIQNSSGHSGTATLTISRLEGNTNNGIWEVTSAGTSSMSITAPLARSQLHSPFDAKGTGSAFEDVIGTLTLMDHLYNTIGQAQVKGEQGNGQTSFSTHVSYMSTFANGSEEGVLALIATSQADGSISGVVMQKALL